MVVHAFPAAKLGALLIKQISKPIANAVKQGAKSSPVFRKYVCLPPAQFYNWCEVKAKMWLLNLGQPVNITVLNEAASIELGANLLGETIIFIIAAGVLTFEYNRSSRKEAAKEQARLEELQQLKDAVRDLFIQTEEQGAYIREISRKLGSLEGNAPKPSLLPKRHSENKQPPKEPPELLFPIKLQKKELAPNPPKPSGRDSLEESKYRPLKGVIFRALNDVENDFFVDPNRRREPSIVTEALNHLYNNVYRSRLTF